MFAESATAAPQVVSMWDYVVASGIVNLGVLGGGATVLWWVFKRWVNGIDEGRKAVQADVEALDEAKVDNAMCESRIQGIHEKIDGLEARVDDVHDIQLATYQKVNGGQPYQSPRRPK